MKRPGVMAAFLWTEKGEPPFTLRDAVMLLGASATVLLVALISLAAAVGAAVGLFVAGLALAIKVREWRRYLADLECPECGISIGSR